MGWGEGFRLIQRDWNTVVPKEVTVALGGAAEVEKLVSSGGARSITIQEELIMIRMDWKFFLHEMQCLLVVTVVCLWS